MPDYKVIRKSDGEEVSRYSAMQPTEASGFNLDDFDHADITVTPVVDTSLYAGRRLLTKLEFVALLGDTAYVALLGMARESVQVDAFVQLVDWATVDANGWSVNLDDPRMGQLSVLEPALIALGAVTEGWAQEVLNG